MSGLIGRDRELASIDEVLAKAWTNESGALLLVGPPGIGKTALLDAACDRGRGRFEMVSEGGSAAESDLSYGLIGRVLLHLEAHLGSLAPWQSETVAALLPGRSFAPRSLTDRFTVGAAALALLGAAAEITPLLIIIDDAHWVDDESADALVFAVRRLAGDRVAVILGSRPTVRARSLDELPKLTLAGLDQESASQLLADRVPNKVPSDRVLHFTEATGGNPLALLDLPRLLSSDELNGLVPTRELPPIRETLVSAYRGKLKRKPENVQMAALIAALIGPVTLPVLAGALDKAGLSIADLAQAEENDLAEDEDVDPADTERKWLLRVTPNGVEFRHPLVAAAMLAEAGEFTRRSAHAAIAAALDESADPNDVPLRAWHRAESVIGLDDGVARMMEEAAVQAAGASGFGSAAVAFERAAQLSSHDDDRRRRYVAAAEAAYHAGWSDRASELLRSGTEGGMSDWSLQKRAAEIGGELARSLGRPGEAVRLLTTAAERLAAAHPEDASWLWLLSVEAATFMGDMAAAQRAIDSARRFAGDRQDLHGLADAGAGVVHLLSGQSADGLPLLSASAQAMLEALRQSEREALPLQMQDPFLLQMATGIGFTLSTVDEHDLAEDLLSAVVTRSVSIGAGAALPMALSSRANIRYRRGDWIAAQADADWGLGVARSTGRQLDISGCLVINALLDASVGREGNLKQHLSEAIGVLQENEVATTLAQVHYMQGLFDLASHRPVEAIKAFEQMRYVCERGGLGEVGHWQWPADLVEAYVRSGRTAAAAPALQRLQEHSDATGRPIVKAFAARCRGLVTPDGFQPEFEEALDWHDKSGRPFEKARTQLCFGERLRRAKQRAAARRQLEAARQTFAQLGATRWAKHAYDELEASGVHSAGGARSYTAQLESLTHQEREVAMAVASGASNDEAAARLFLSTKTVEYHLSKVYRKLSASRSTLAKALEASVGEDLVPEGAVSSQAATEMDQGFDQVPAASRRPASLSPMSTSALRNARSKK